MIVQKDITEELKEYFQQREQDNKHHLIIQSYKKNHNSCQNCSSFNYDKNFCTRIQTRVNVYNICLYFKQTKQERRN